MSTKTARARAAEHAPEPVLSKINISDELYHITPLVRVLRIVGEAFASGGGDGDQLDGHAGSNVAASAEEALQALRKRVEGASADDDVGHRSLKDRIDDHLHDAMRMADVVVELITDMFDKVGGHEDLLGKPNCFYFPEDQVERAVFSVIKAHEFAKAASDRYQDLLEAI